MEKIIKHLINEQLTEQYQIRDIDGIPVFLKRFPHEKTWKHISLNEFSKNAHKGKLIQFKTSTT